MAWVPRKINNPASLVARKRLEINILTRHKLPVPPPPPQNQMVVLLIFLLMCVSSVGFAWGVLRGVLGEYAVL